MTGSPLKHFDNKKYHKEASLGPPILFSNFLSKNYIFEEQVELRNNTKDRLKVFYKEELDMPLVLFNKVQDHMLRSTESSASPRATY